MTTLFLLDWGTLKLITDEYEVRSVLFCMRQKLFWAVLPLVFREASVVNGVDGTGVEAGQAAGAMSLPLWLLVCPYCDVV